MVVVCFFTKGRWIEIENIQDTGDGLALEQMIRVRAGDEDDTDFFLLHIITYYYALID